MGAQTLAFEGPCGLTSDTRARVGWWQHALASLNRVRAPCSLCRPRVFVHARLSADSQDGFKRNNPEGPSPVHQCLWSNAQLCNT